MDDSLDLEDFFSKSRIPSIIKSKYRIFSEGPTWVIFFPYVIRRNEKPPQIVQNL